ncbi:hypothetical protein [Litoribacillus peritrichatus]|uniref:Uncharacterized protein n=1 Tax=Litoribacillus peritrichatus TaxID=718191 RepID=A0ABP7MU07_9GAMM
MKVIKSLLRGFRGGPDFTETHTINTSFDDINFSISLPYTNVDTQEKPRNIQFPISKQNWFESNCTQSRQHHYVPISTQMWMYVPSVKYTLNGELGVLFCSSQIKKVPKDKEIDAFNLDALGTHLLEEYDQHYNSPVIGGPEDHGQGLNTEIRQKVDLLSESLGSPFSKSEYDRELRLRMEAMGFPPLSPYKVVSIKNRQWVYYSEPQVNSLSKDNMYCFPLSNEFYLCLQFRYRVDINDKFKLWKDHAEAAENRIMESVKLTFPSNEKALPST